LKEQNEKRRKECRSFVFERNTQENHETDRLFGF
jgi:hypothetical protein